MDFDRVPFVGLWAKPGAPFVCIEPWHGICDSPTVSGKIEEKPYINSLAPSVNSGFLFYFHIVKNSRNKTAVFYPMNICVQ